MRVEGLSALLCIDVRCILTNKTKIEYQEDAGIDR